MGNPIEILMTGYAPAAASVRLAVENVAEIANFIDHFIDPK
jgi:hypothetical protein